MKNDKKLFPVRIDQLQPSQPWLSQSRLKNIAGHIDFLKRPVPVRMLNGRLCIVEGHERCFALASSGIHKVDAYLDTKKNISDIAFQKMVKISCDEGISSINDMEERFLSPVEFRHLWLEKKRKVLESSETMSV